MKHCTPNCESRRLPRWHSSEPVPTVEVKRLSTGTIETCLDCGRKVEYSTYSGAVNVWNEGNAR